MRSLWKGASEGCVSCILELCGSLQKEGNMYSPYLKGIARVAADIGLRRCACLLISLLTVAYQISDLARFSTFHFQFWSQSLTIYSVAARFFAGDDATFGGLISPCARRTLTELLRSTLSSVSHSASTEDGLACSYAVLIRIAVLRLMTGRLTARELGVESATELLCLPMLQLTVSRSLHDYVKWAEQVWISRDSPPVLSLVCLFCLVFFFIYFLLLLILLSELLLLFFVLHLFGVSILSALLVLNEDIFSASFSWCNVFMFVHLFL